MGTNFYLRFKPSKEAKEALIDAINDNQYSKIEDCYHEMYCSLEYDYANEMFKGGYVHLGKRSGGWKFLWNPNIAIKRNGHVVEVENEHGVIEKRWKVDASELIYFYPLTKEGIKTFIDKDDVIILDEYDEIQNKEEFWNMAFNWGHEKDDIGYDAGTYEEKYPEEKKYVCDSELIRLLEKEGYKFSSVTKSDFYSDGLRFSTSTDFC